MIEVCVDASLAAKLVLRGERLRPYAKQLFVDSAVTGGSIIVPPLFICEVDSVIRFSEISGRISSEGADAAHRELEELDITVIQTDNIGTRRRAREIARLYGQERVYDSTYAALAEMRGCEFWTADRAFYAAVKDALTFVRYLADYPLP